MITHKFHIIHNLPRKNLGKILNLFLTQKVLNDPFMLLMFEVNHSELLASFESNPYLSTFVLSDPACLELSKIHAALEWSLWGVVATIINYIEHSTDHDVIAWKWDNRKLF